jgi:hypothetical protein
MESFRPASALYRYLSARRSLEVEKRVCEKEASQRASPCCQGSPTGTRAIVLRVVSTLLVTARLVVAAICPVVVAAVSVWSMKLPALWGSPGRERRKHKSAGPGPGRDSEGGHLARLWIALRHLHLHHLVGLDPVRQLHLERPRGRLLLLLHAHPFPSRIAHDDARTPRGVVNDVRTWTWYWGGAVGFPFPAVVAGQNAHPFPLHSGH